MFCRAKIIFRVLSQKSHQRLTLSRTMNEHFVFYPFFCMTNLAFSKIPHLAFGSGWGAFFSDWLRLGGKLVCCISLGCDKIINKFQVLNITSEYALQNLLYGVPHNSYLEDPYPSTEITYFIFFQISLASLICSFAPPWENPAKQRSENAALRRVPNAQCFLLSLALPPLSK